MDTSFIQQLRNIQNNNPDKKIIDVYGGKRRDFPYLQRITSLDSAGMQQGGPGAMGYDANTGAYSYTVKKGDSFGQIIKDLGLQTDYGLWGKDGDINYYTQQLIDQGALNKNGNIPVGTTIKLWKRGGENPDQSNPDATETNVPNISKFVEKLRKTIKNGNIFQKGK